MVHPTQSVPIDAELQFADGGTTITADGVTEVASVDAVIDFGADAFVEGMLVIDIDDMDSTTGDESYEIKFQVSDSSGFATTYTTAAKPVGGTGAYFTGRYTLRVDNIAQTASGQSKPMRYARCLANVGGTTPSFAPKIWLSLN